MLLLRCPKCKNCMKYQNTSSLIGKRKVCVYCGNSFKVLSSVIRQE